MPTGVSIYPQEIFRASRHSCEAHYRYLIHYNALDRSGHFAAFEQPTLFVDDLRKASGLCAERDITRRAQAPIALRRQSARYDCTSEMR